MGKRPVSSNAPNSYSSSFADASVVFGAYNVSPIVIPDLVRLNDPISICSLHEECMRSPSLEVFLAERLSALSIQPAGRHLDIDKLRLLDPPEQLPYVFAASLYDKEWPLYVQGGLKQYYKVHGCVARGEHADVNLISSLQRGVLCSFRACSTGLVASGAPLFARRGDLGPLAKNLIASRARLMEAARQFVAACDPSIPARRVDFEAYIYSKLPGAKAGDIQAAWQSEVVPEKWRRAGTKRRSIAG